MKNIIEEILQEFTANEDYRPMMNFIHNSGKFLVATDGHVLAEISLKEFPQLETIGDKKADFPNWKAVIPDPYERETEYIEISDLKTPPELITDPYTVECPECDGKGRDGCTECEGVGKVEPHIPLELICINHHYYYQAKNINKLVRLIEALQSEPVELSQEELGQNGNASALMIEAPGVRLLAMPVIDSADTDHKTINKAVTRNPKPAN